MTTQHDQTQSPPTLLILDCATTGFRPGMDVILELACILVDASTLDVIDTCAHVIKHTAEVLERKVPDFHEALLLECIEGPHAVPIARAEGLLLAGPWTTARMVVNRAIDYFDMKFIAAEMPTLHKALQRKLTLDLRSLEVLVTARGIPAFTNLMPKTYRAPDDAIAALDELAYYRNVRAA